MPSITACTYAGGTRTKADGMGAATGVADGATEEGAAIVSSSSTAPRPAAPAKGIRVLIRLASRLRAQGEWATDSSVKSEIRGPSVTEDVRGEGADAAALAQPGEELGDEMPSRTSDL